MKLVSDRVTRQQLEQAIPDMSVLEAKLLAQIKKITVEAEDRFLVTVRKLDERVVQIRKDTDMDTFKTTMAEKANAEETNQQLADHADKLLHLGVTSH